jgi:hypothetical protein
MRALSQGNRVKTGSSSFLKKRTKKLLNPGPSLSGETEANVQKFFASFFQKRGLASEHQIHPIALRFERH